MDLNLPSQASDSEVASLIHGASFYGEKLTKLATTVQGKAIAQTANGVNFAMGCAWSAALLALITPHEMPNDDDPHETPIKTLWMWTGIISLVLIVVMLALTKVVKDHQAKVAQSVAEGNLDLAIRHRNWEMTLTTFVKWGLGSCVSGLVDQAVNATISDTWQSHLYYLLSTIVVNLILVVAIRFVLRANGLDDRKLPISTQDMTDCSSPKADGASVAGADGSFTKVTADVWFSTGALISAMAFLSTVETFFRVDPSLNKNTDVVKLYIFSLIAVSVAGIVLALLQNAETADAQQNPGRQPVRTGLYIRKFISKMFTMCAATIVYLLIYVSVVELQFKIQPGDEEHSIYDPLPVWSAAILLGSSMLINLTVGLFIERSLKATAAGIAAVPRDVIPGVIDDAILATLQSVAQTTASSYMAAFSWLVGSAMHKFFTSLWTEYYDGHANWVLSEGIYTGIVTVLAIVASFCMPPPPKEV